MAVFNLIFRDNFTHVQASTKRRSQG